jgi:hypothetical protein
VDPAFLLGGSLSIEDRRAHEQALIRQYHEGLLAAGVTGYHWEACWADYRRYALYGLLAFVGTSVSVEMHERGAQLYLAAFRRY